MILLSIIFLFVVIPLLWAALVALREVLVWQSEHSIAKQLSPKFGREVYQGGSLGSRVWEAFKWGYWSAFYCVAGLAMLGLLLWFIFKD